MEPQRLSIHTNTPMNIHFHALNSFRRAASISFAFFLSNWSVKIWMGVCMQLFAGECKISLIFENGRAKLVSDAFVNYRECQCTKLWQRWKKNYLISCNKGCPTMFQVKQLFLCASRVCAFYCTLIAIVCLCEYVCLMTNFRHENWSQNRNAVLE